MKKRNTGLRSPKHRQKNVPTSSDNAFPGGKESSSSILKKRAIAYSREAKKLIKLIAHSAHGGIDGTKSAQESRALRLVPFTTSLLLFVAPRGTSRAPEKGLRAAAVPVRAPRRPEPRGFGGGFPQPRTEPPHGFSAPSRANSCSRLLPPTKLAGWAPSWHRSLKGAACERVSVGACCTPAAERRGEPRRPISACTPASARSAALGM